MWVAISYEQWHNIMKVKITIIRQSGKEKIVIEEKKTSEIISDFLRLMDKVENKYISAKSSMEEQDKVTQDFLHYIELETADIEPKLIIESIKENRKMRREYKDSLEEAEPMLQFLEKHRTAINALKQLLGNIRKIEERHTHRYYIPKTEILDLLHQKIVSTQEDIQKQDEEEMQESPQDEEQIQESPQDEKEMQESPQDEEQIQESPQDEEQIQESSQDEEQIQEYSQKKMKKKKKKKK